MQSTEVKRFKLVPRAGVEPARPFGQRILSPQRLPFRHPGMLSVALTIPKNFLISLSHQKRDAYVNEPKMGHPYIRLFGRGNRLLRHGPIISSRVGLSAHQQE